MEAPPSNTWFKSSNQSYPIYLFLMLIKRTEIQRQFGNGGRHVSKEIFDHRHITTKDEFLLSHTERGSNPKV